MIEPEFLRKTQETKVKIRKNLPEYLKKITKTKA